MRTLVTIVLITFSTMISAQNKFHMLAEKDPLVGDWIFVSNDTVAPVAPFNDDGWMMIRLVAGSNNSAASSDSSAEFYCPAYFIAFTDGNQLMGTVSDCCNKNIKGKHFTLKYTYENSTDELIITWKSSKVVYRRRKS